MTPITAARGARTHHSGSPIVKPKEMLLAVILFILGSRRKDPFVGERRFLVELPALEDITLTSRGEITLSLRRFRR